MELEFERKQIPCLRTLLRQLQTQEQTQELRVSEGMPDIGRVLGGWGQVILRGKEWRGDSISISGGCLVWVLYVPEDGSQLQQLESWIPFQMKWNLEEVGREGDIWVQPMLRFLDVRSTSARKIMVRCGVGAMAQALRQENGELAVPGELPGDIQVLKNRYPLQIPRAYGEKPFPLEEELTFPGTAPAPEKLLAYTLEMKIGEARLMADKLVLRGQGILHVVYLSDAGKLFAWDFELPISQLEQLETDFSPEARAEVQMAVTSLELELTGEGQLRLKANLLAQYMLSDREMVELVEDAYSPLRPVQLKMGQLDVPRILEQRQMAVPVRQTLRSDAAALAEVSFLPDFPEVRKGERVRLELPGQFQAFYYDESGSLKSATARTEEHLELDAGENAQIQATLQPGANPTGSLNGGMELRGERQLQIRTMARDTLPLVTGLQVGEISPKDPARPSVILRRAGEEALWSIAKSTGSTVTAIREANDLETDPEFGRILLIPVS